MMNTYIHMNKSPLQTLKQINTDQTLLAEKWWRKAVLHTWIQLQARVSKRICEYTLLGCVCRMCWNECPATSHGMRDKSCFLGPSHIFPFLLFALRCPGWLTLLCDNSVVQQNILCVCTACRKKCKREKWISAFLKLACKVASRLEPRFAKLFLGWMQKRTFIVGCLRWG